MIEISDYKSAVEVLRHPFMAQALYEKSPVIMADVLLTLQGDEHRDRRQLEYRVFDRYSLLGYERNTFPAIFEPVLRSNIESGQADLVEVGYRTVMNLTADFAGIDRLEKTAEETDALLELIKTFSAAATIEHTNLDPEAINEAAMSALRLLDERFLQPAIARRRKLIEAGSEMPNDVLSSLLQADRQLSEEVLLREIAFYLQAGAHSTANATVHAMHEILTWCQQDGARREMLLADRVLIQCCVHESLRLHPASPVSLRRVREPMEITGRFLQAGDLVSVNLDQANRDQSVFGDDADEFRPDRQLPPAVRPYGLSFGVGIHGCLGRDLDGGVVPKSDTDSTDMQLGIVGLMIEALLKCGAKWISGLPPEPDTHTTRNNFSVYPIALEKPA